MAEPNWSTTIVYVLFAGKKTSKSLPAGPAVPKATWFAGVVVVPW